jgi:dihydrolipoamide dehydrogenase
MEKSYDIVMIGSGPGGYVAAIRAAQLGMKAAVVEEGPLGGVCLNWGCIPTKALIKSAEVFTLMKRAGQFGLKAADPDFDFPAVIKRSRNTAGRLSKGVGLLFKKHQIDIYEGRGRLTNRQTVAVSGADGGISAEIRGGAVILATGARPRSIPGVAIDEERIISSTRAMTLEKRPASMVIIGAGAIGVEFAYFFSSFGTKVTLVEMLPSVLPLSDAEAGDLLRKNFQRKGIRVLTGTRVLSVEKKGSDLIEVAFQKDQEASETVEAEYALMAVGVQGNVEDLGLEEAGVTAEKGIIQTDSNYRTTAPGVFAIGDVTGPPQLAHAASAQGVFTVETLAGRTAEPPDKDHVPACTYCHPEVASIGLTEAEAVEQGLAFKAGRFPFVANGRALASGEREGMVKVLYDAADESLLGAHIIGPEATELIAVFTLAKRLGLKGKQIAEAVYAHPTLSETIPEATLDALDQAIHL